MASPPGRGASLLYVAEGFNFAKRNRACTYTHKCKSVLNPRIPTLTTKHLVFVIYYVGPTDLIVRIVFILSL